MTDDLVTQIDQLIAVLASVQKPAADLLSTVESTLYGLRQARFALRPSESPALAERRHSEARRNGGAAPAKTRAQSKRPARILTIFEGKEEPMSNADVLAALVAAGDECPMTIVNTVLSNLAQRKLLERVGAATYRRLPTNPS